MCLIGVDYFSTLGYKPGIAFLAAGFLSLIATLVLVLVTLFGALPACARVAELSPHGQGSSTAPEWARASRPLVLIITGIAAILLDLRDRTGATPHAHFGWTEGNPITYLLRFLAFGEGETAPVAREVLRQAERRPERRPRIHVGQTRMPRMPRMTRMMTLTLTIARVSR
jgi:hypothetical protein